MNTEISRTKVGDGISIVQRTKGIGLQVIKEVTSSTGESTVDDLTTVETITITRTQLSYDND